MLKPILICHPNGTVQVDNGTERVIYRYAGFGDRFLARIIDSLIMIIPASFIPLLAPWLYYSLMQSGSDNATVGQKAMGIKVISSDGMSVSFGQATGRYFGNLLNLFTFFIGYLMFFFTPHKQCLHDMLAGTYVVREVGRTVSAEGIDQIGQH